MTVRLLVAPIAAGKTQFVLAEARQQAAGFAARPVILVASEMQKRSALHRLARSGSVLGITVSTISQFLATIRRDAGLSGRVLGASEQRGRMRSLLRQMSVDGELPYYRSLADSAGLADRLIALFAELVEAGVTPDLLRAVCPAGVAERRLVETAAIFGRWTQQLSDDNVMTQEIACGRSVESLAGMRHAWMAQTPLYVDGFCQFSGLMLQLLGVLHTSPGADVTLTLSSHPEFAQCAAYHRFAAARRRVEAALGIAAEPLPDCSLRPAEAYQPELAHLCAAIAGDPITPPSEAGAAVEQIEASTRSLEAREAVRWVKRRIAVDGLAPDNCAIMARHSAAWEPFIAAAADEYGVPVTFVSGQPLQNVPVIAAIIRLLQSFRRRENGSLRVGRLDLVGLWRSPWFSWERCGFLPGDADLLDRAARAAGVSGGDAAWLEALALLDAHPSADTGGQQFGDDDATENDSDEGPAPTCALDQATAQRLQSAFATFLALWTPPDFETLSARVNWLASRLSDAPADILIDPNGGDLGLNVRANATSGATDDVRINQAALDGFDAVLADLAREGRASKGGPMPFDQFVAELTAAVEHTRVTLDDSHSHAVSFGPVEAMRGVPFDAVALMGMAEGEFPSLLREDPFLRDEDRKLLRTHCPDLALPTHSAERELFLEAVSSANQSLLCTRARLAEDGALWEPSPFWNEIAECTCVKPVIVRSGQPVASHLAASHAETLLAYAARPDPRLARIIDGARPDALSAVQRATQVIAARSARKAARFDGSLQDDAPAFARRYHAGYQWSATALEGYLGCPFRFLVADALGLEATAEPGDEIDRATQGNINHAVLAEVYRRCSISPAKNDLLAAFDAVMEKVLDEAPRVYGFRPPPGWTYLRSEMTEGLRKALAELAGYDAREVRCEVRVGYDAPCEVTLPDARFLLIGRVDRVDVLADGRVCIIDYKLSSSHLEKTDLEQGKRIQMGLYAGALEAEMGEGAVQEGLYFALSEKDKTKSNDKYKVLNLGSLNGGVRAAIDLAMDYAWQAIQGVRAGEFRPAAPRDGCPTWCPAAGFCPHFWNRRAR